MAISIIGIAVAGCSRSKPAGSDQPTPSQSDADEDKKALAAAKAAGQIRRRDMEFLTGHQWIVGQGDSGNFLPVATGVRFSEDGKMNDWFRSMDLGTFKIDTSKTPKHIDLTINGETRPCVYEITTGNRPEIRLCIPAVKGGPRPNKVEDPWKSPDFDKAQQLSKQVHYLILSHVVKAKE